MDEVYAYYKKLGVCPKCGIRSAAPGRVLCESCLAKDAERHKRRTDAMSEQEKAERRERFNEKRKKRQDKRRSEGKCVWCGKPLSKYSICFCPDCRIKNQRKNERKKSGIPRSERPQYGICYRCGKNPIIPGKKLCRECYEQAVSALKVGGKSEKVTVRRNYIRQQNDLIFGG